MTRSIAAQCEAPCDGVSANMVAGVTDSTPVSLLDPAVSVRKAERFCALLPDVGLYYAVKANSSPALLDALRGRVEGFDVASAGEIRALLEMGVDPGTLRFSNPVKVPSHIEYAHAVGVRAFAFDSRCEIGKLARHAPGCSVYLRIATDDEHSLFPLSRKFGASRADALLLCQEAAAAGLDVTGVTFHVGSQAAESDSWTSAIRAAGDIMRELISAELPVHTLNIGGGFPADYGVDSPAFKTVAAAVNSALAEHVPVGLAVVAEPGRYLVAEAGATLAGVIGRESRGGQDWLYLDIGVFNGLMECLELGGFCYPAELVGRCGGAATIATLSEFTLAGPSCDGLDVLGAGYLLPSDVTVGDRVLLRCTGAYSTVYASNFNGFDVPNCVAAQVLPSEVD